ncbi:MAG: hypothetical protein K8R25_12035 [Methanosarcinales archaeon]|nr:hypothetical protein [Methanosarcinales archaeon]
MVHEIIQTHCAQCSPDEMVPHTILKEGTEPLIKCKQCGAIHQYRIPKTKSVDIRIVVSTGDHSSTHRLSLDSDKIVSIDDEFMVEDELHDQANFVLVTSIESGDKRVDSAKADEILTLWARSTDKVIAKISITRGWQTDTIDLQVPGDREFSVGETISRGPDVFRIKKIKIRNGRFTENEGEPIKAKYIKRIFTDSVERIEWLNRPAPKKTKKGSPMYTNKSIIKPRGSNTWTLKTKERD